MDLDSDGRFSREERDSLLLTQPTQVAPSFSALPTVRQVTPGHLTPGVVPIPRQTVLLGQAERVCSCGNHLLPDANYCRKCGKPWLQMQAPARGLSPTDAICAVPAFTACTLSTRRQLFEERDASPPSYKLCSSDSWLASPGGGVPPVTAKLTTRSLSNMRSPATFSTASHGFSGFSHTSQLGSSAGLDSSTVLAWPTSPQRLRTLTRSSSAPHSEPISRSTNAVQSPPPWTCGFESSSTMFLDAKLEAALMDFKRSLFEMVERRVQRVESNFDQYEWTLKKLVKTETSEELLPQTQQSTRELSMSGVSTIYPHSSNGGNALIPDDQLKDVRELTEDLRRQSVSLRDRFDAVQSEMARKTATWEVTFTRLTQLQEELEQRGADHSVLTKRCSDMERQFAKFCASEHKIASIEKDLEATSKQTETICFRIDEVQSTLQQLRAKASESPRVRSSPRHVAAAEQTPSDFFVLKSRLDGAERSIEELCDKQSKLEAAQPRLLKVQQECVSAAAAQLALLERVDRLEQSLHSAGGGSLEARFQAIATQMTKYHHDRESSSRGISALEAQLQDIVAQLGDTTERNARLELARMNLRKVIDDQEACRRFQVALHEKMERLDCGHQEIVRRFSQQECSQAALAKLKRDLEAQVSRHEALHDTVERAVLEPSCTRVSAQEAARGELASLKGEHEALAARCSSLESRVRQHGTWLDEADDKHSKWSALHAKVLQLAGEREQTASQCKALEVRLCGFEQARAPTQDTEARDALLQLKRNLTKLEQKLDERGHHHTKFNDRLEYIERFLVNIRASVAPTLQQQGWDVRSVSRHHEVVDVDVRSSVRHVESHLHSRQYDPQPPQEGQQQQTDYATMAEEALVAAHQAAQAAVLESKVIDRILLELRERVAQLEEAKLRCKCCAGACCLAVTIGSPLERKEVTEVATTRNMSKKKAGKEGAQRRPSSVGFRCVEEWVPPPHGSWSARGDSAWRELGDALAGKSDLLGSTSAQGEPRRSSSVGFRCADEWEPPPRGKWSAGIAGDDAASRELNDTASGILKAQRRKSFGGARSVSPRCPSK